MFIPVPWKKDTWEKTQWEQDESRPKQLFRRVFGVFKNKQTKTPDANTPPIPRRPISEPITLPKPALLVAPRSHSYPNDLHAVQFRTPDSTMIVRKSRERVEVSSSATEPLLSLRAIELASNAKIYLETYFDRILGSPSPRSLRRRALENLIREFGLGPADAARCWDEWKVRETEHLRRCRGKLQIEDFDVVRVIGKGAFGCVKLARMGKAGEVFAVKVIRKAVQLKNGQEAHLRAERDLLVASEGSRWIVPLVASFQDDENLYLVMEYMIGGDFLGFLIEKGVLGEGITRFYVAEMILCIEEVHRLCFIHRDVKPDNFCITASGHLKICDFGLAFSGHWAHDGAYFEQQRWGLIKKSCINVDGDSIDKRDGKAIARALSTATAMPIPRGERILSWRNKRGQRRMARSIVGTYQYMAPEVIREQAYDARCDWWSLGVIVYECLFGYTPFHGETKEESKVKVVSWREHLALETNPRLSPEIKDLVRSLICEKEARLGSTKYRLNDEGDQLSKYVYPKDAEEIKEHPFFDAINWPVLHMQVPPFVPDGLLDETDTKYFTESFTSEESSGDGYSEKSEVVEIRAKDLLLRDSECGEEILEVRKKSAFLGYTYTRPANVGLERGLFAC